MRMIYFWLGNVLFSPCINRRGSGRSSRHARKQHSSATHSRWLAPIGQASQDHIGVARRERNMKHIDPRLSGAVALTLALGACVTAPTAPTIPVVPGANKQFSAFAAEQNYCQQYATAQVAPQAAAANNQAVGTGILTTALGAGLGAAVAGGGSHGNAGHGPENRSAVSVF